MKKSTPTLVVLGTQHGGLLAYIYARIAPVPPMANYAKLLELIGPARMLEMMYTGRLIDADEALAFGMLNVVIPEDDIDAHVAEPATNIAEAAPITVRVSKETVRRLTRETLPDGDDLIQACYRSEDFQEGVAALL